MQLLCFVCFSFASSSVPPFRKKCIDFQDSIDQILKIYSVAAPQLLSTLILKSNVNTIIPAGELSYLFLFCAKAFKPDFHITVRESATACDRSPRTFRLTSFHKDVSNRERSAGEV